MDGDDNLDKVEFMTCCANSRGLQEYFSSLGRVTDTSGDALTVQVLRLSLSLGSVAFFAAACKGPFIGRLITPHPRERRLKPHFP